MKVCNYSTAGATDLHTIPDGARTLSLTFDVDWGDTDLRESHSKPLTFCSFRCLTGWAADKAAQHDSVTVTDGAA